MDGRKPRDVWGEPQPFMSFPPGDYSINAHNFEHVTSPQKEEEGPSMSPTHRYLRY